MPKITGIQLTPEGLENLKKELEALAAKRPGVLHRMVEAREQGDLSENAGYHAAKEELGNIDRRTRELKIMIRTANVIDTQSGDNINLGSKVTLKTGEDTVSFTIVGELEANPANGKMSNASPIGGALIGKKVGDTIQVAIPDGTVSYQILSVDN